MKEGPADAADVRATLQLNFVTSLMYALPVAIVGLQLVLMKADLTQISTSFLVANIAAWTGLIVARQMTKCCKPAVLIAAGLFTGLISSFFLIDYGKANQTSEKML